VNSNILNIREVVLSTLLSANEYENIDINAAMRSGINRDYFELEEHQCMFDVIKVCYEGNITYDESIVVNYMKKAGINSPEQTVLQIMAQKQVPQNTFMEYVSFLKEQYKRTMLLKLNANIAELLRDENAQSDVVMQMMQNSLDNFSSLNVGAYTRKLSEVRELRKQQPPAQRIKTGIPFIDTVLTDKNGDKGIRNEGLFFISGKKQSGKTFVLTRLIENVSKELPVMFGSMEFGQDLYDENIEEQQKEGIFEGNIENIYTFDALYDVNQIIAEIRLQHKLHGIKLVALDSMMRMTNLDPELKTDERRISEMFSKLGKLSKEIKVPIIVVVQSSKEDLKSSVISVKGSMNADHEAYVWFHLAKTFPKQVDDETRTVIWNKNKDTHKHPIQHLMFVPQTSDFYRVEMDENGHAGEPLDKFRRPAPKVVETVYETVPQQETSAHPTYDMPEF